MALLPSDVTERCRCGKTQIVLPAPRRFKRRGASNEGDVTLALTQGLVARAIFVPSSPKRTLALNAIIGVLLIAGVYVAWAEVPPQYLRALRGAWGSDSGLPLSKALSTGFWWALTALVCAASSHVIYGLRAKVQRAKQLGQYTLGEKLGEGAMGMVFRAHHGMLRRPTAIKLLLPD